MPSKVPHGDWQSQVAQSQAARDARIKRLTQGPTILRNAMLDTPFEDENGHVCTVGDALRFEDYLAIRNEVTDGRENSVSPLASALIDKREEIDAYANQFIEAMLNTRSGPNSTQRYNLRRAASEFCAMLKSAIQLGDAPAITNLSRYQTALSLDKAIPEIERALRHAKARIDGSDPLVGKGARASR